MRIKMQLSTLAVVGRVRMDCADAALFTSEGYASQIHISLVRENMAVAIIKTAK